MDSISRSNVVYDRVPFNTVVSSGSGSGGIVVSSLPMSDNSRPTSGNSNSTPGVTPNIRQHSNGIPEQHRAVQYSPPMPVTPMPANASQIHSNTPHMPNESVSVFGSNLVLVLQLSLMLHLYILDNSLPFQYLSFSCF